MKPFQVTLLVFVSMLGAGLCAEGQLPSSSSGLVFPGPPRRKSGEPEVGALQRPRPVYSQQSALPVPLSLIGQQPEEFVAAAQRRQQQQQLLQQQQQAQRAAQREEEEEEDEEEAVEPVRQPVPTSQRRQEFQRPEPSINQAVQQRRPNYPANYKPPAQQGGEGPRRPPNSINEQVEEVEQTEETEEEEVKPDKLQLLLQKTQFSCSEKKDGYYADEEVDCEIFHYCQDKTRHSWLCPAGATFHQVHLLCMPVGKDNICDKSSQFHFVNDYLYKTVENEDGSNASSGIYADRYYPEGYEQGKEFDMSEVVQPDRPNLQPFNRRQPSTRPDERQRRPAPGPQQRHPGPNRDRPFNNDNRRIPSEPARRPAPQIPEQSQQSDDEESDSPFNEQNQEESETPSFRSSEDAFDRRGRPQPDDDINDSDE